MATESSRRATVSDLRAVLMTWLDENFYQAEDFDEEAERLERLLRRVIKYHDHTEGAVGAILGGLYAAGCV